jgi:hypothetical protein
MTKKALLLFVLALALPMAVAAQVTVDFTNIGGLLSESVAGLSLSGSELIAVSINKPNGHPKLLTGTLGVVSFTTGVLITGSPQFGGTFAGGGFFTITGNGTKWVPNGVIFSGTFAGPATWTMITSANGTHQYTLTAAVSGEVASGDVGNGVTVQLTFDTGPGYFNGSVPLSSGDTAIAVPNVGAILP